MTLLNNETTEFINKVKGTGWLLRFALSKHRKKQSSFLTAQKLEIEPAAKPDVQKQIESKKEAPVELPQESKWLKVLTREKEKKELQEKGNRVARLANLFDSDEEQRMDALAA